MVCGGDCVCHRYDDVDEKWFESSEFHPSTKKLLADKPGLAFINRRVALAHPHTLHHR